MSIVRLKTLVFDNITGYFDIAIRDQQPPIEADQTTKGEWGLQWNTLMGRWSQIGFLLNEIADRHQMNVIIIGHIVASYIGKGDDRRQNGWKIDIPGQGADQVLVPFDEVYYLTAIATATGGVPLRKLICQPVTIEGYPFDAGTRFGVKSPIGPNPTPTFATIRSATPKGEQPRKFLLVGRPKIGKTTLAASIVEEGPVLFVDMMGGADVVARRDGIYVVKPRTLPDVFRTLMKVRARPEWQVTDAIASSTAAVA